MAKSLKKQATKGLFWSGTEKFVNEAIQFIIGIVLARLLTPEDYGIVAIIMVFITISQLFIDGRMTTALIQKKDRTDVDFHTVFFFNLGMSLLFYCLMFFCAPLVARFYHNDELISLLRVLALVLIITPFASIQITQLTIKLDFKKISLVSIPSSLISGGLGILLAYKGFGAYSLVCQQIAMVFCRSVFVNIISDYRIRLVFSWLSFKELFSFSYKLVLASSLDRIYTSICSLLIGKSFSPSMLGLYNRGVQFPSKAAGIMGDIFDRVTLPVMSSVQDENERLRVVFRKYIVGSSFVICPVLVLLIIIAKPLVIVLLTEKWIEAVPILQLMCLAYMVNHISNINRNLLYSQHRSDLALKLEVIKKSVAMTIFFISLHFGIIGVCWGQVIYGFIAAFLNSFYTRKFIGVNIWQQTFDYMKIIIIAFISAIVPYLVINHFGSYVVQLIVASLLFIGIYIFISVLLRLDFLADVKDILIDFVTGHKNKK